jgi:hypothetical protein
MIGFLEQAHVSNPSEICFFYWVGDLACMSEKDDRLTSCMDAAYDEDGRFLLLYSMNGMFGSHGLGLM